jgi:hypothetical protein
MNPAFAFFVLVVAGLVSLTSWAGRRLPGSHLVTWAWLVIAGVGFGVVAQSYLVAAFRVIDSGTVVFVAIPAIGVFLACVAGCFAWLRNSSLNSGFRVLALTLLAFDFAAMGLLAAAAPF